MKFKFIQLQMRQVWAVAKKNMKIYYSESPIIIFGILFPFFLFLAFALGRGVPVKELIPGLLGITFFFAGSSVGPFITPWETRTKTLERLLTTPSSVFVLIMGDIFAGFFFSLLISILVIIVGTLVLGGTIINPILMFFVILLGSLCFAGLGSIFSALPTDKPANVMMLANLVRLPIIFVSGVFVPIADIPIWGRIISYVSPVTYFVDLMRYTFGQTHFIPAKIDLGLIILFTLAFLFLAVLFHKKTLVKRI